MRLEWTLTAWSLTIQVVFYKKDVLKNFAKLRGKHQCQSLFYNKAYKETLAWVLSSEFHEIFKNTFSTEYLRWLLLTWENCWSEKDLKVIDWELLSKRYYGRSICNPLSANPTNGQTHSSNSSAIADELFRCV